MTIDNFQIFRDHLTFESKNDRYIVHVLRRPKDLPKEQRTMGANEHQRLIRTWYIDSVEYFDKKVEAIKELCRANNARAYIIPQVRNNAECLWNLSFKVQDAIHLGNMSVKPEHLVRSAYCECHKSRDKKWIIDLDKDEMFDWNLDDVVCLVKFELRAAGRDPNKDMFIVPTKNGHHIVTVPFNLEDAHRRGCNMLFEGQKTMKVDELHTGPGEIEDITKKVTGWLHKDGMSLLFFENED